MIDDITHTKITEMVREFLGLELPDTMAWGIGCSYFKMDDTN